VRADRAKEWKLVDHVFKPQQFAESVKARALELAKQSDRPGGEGIVLGLLKKDLVEVKVDTNSRTAEITIKGPTKEQVQIQRSDTWYPLQLARELDAAILNLRHNYREAGLWILKTKGNVQEILNLDLVLQNHSTDWFVRETIGYLRRTFARLDVSSRSIFAVVEPGSCFAGTLAELLYAADRIYMRDAAENGPSIAFSPLNFGSYPMVNGEARIAAHYCGEIPKLPVGEILDAKKARELGLITSTPDDIDWDDEVRIAIEERVALSPDALTGMEASLRFTGRENMLTRVFGRLSAWQNWIFVRPNAVGEQGALKVYGTGAKAKFNWERV
jgi:benzoyl-CoA-dihydrodiol lyase